MPWGEAGQSGASDGARVVGGQVSAPKGHACGQLGQLTRLYVQYHLFYHG